MSGLNDKKDKTGKTRGLGRRDLLALGAGFTLGGIGAPAAAAVEPWRQPEPETAEPVSPPKVAMLIHPKMVLLDLVGPLTIMNLLPAELHLVWKDKSPVSTDVGLPISASTTFAECPEDLDVLLVPGGISGTIQCMNDLEVTTFLAQRGASARYVTSVCTGSLLLAAAGLLKGYRATSHWAVADLLPLMGARPGRGRVVRDRNRITGGGVTAGLDFGLILATLLKGEEEARRIQLTLEYAPAPPFRNGTPEEAGPQRTAEARRRRRAMDEQARVASEEARDRLGL